jgi:hypothetical protein
VTCLLHFPYFLAGSIKAGLLSVNRALCFAIRYSAWPAKMNFAHALLAGGICLAEDKRFLVRSNALS